MIPLIPLIAVLISMIVAICYTYKQQLVSPAAFLKIKCRFQHTNISQENRTQRPVLHLLNAGSIFPFVAEKIIHTETTSSSRWGSEPSGYEEPFPEEDKGNAHPSGV